MGYRDAGALQAGVDDDMLALVDDHEHSSLSSKQKAALRFADAYLNGPVAIDDELRDELVPINRKWPIAALLDACRRYAAAHGTITFEYVMLDGVNDSDRDARLLVRLLQGVPANVNLIPFNPWPGAAYRCSPDARIARVSARAGRSGTPAPVRPARGRDILAACGQLKTASERLRRRRPAA